ncbi:hypothetical protein ACXGQW_10785 [Wenyingzhuangia sp. IMCC45533]
MKFFLNYLTVLILFSTNKTVAQVVRLNGAATLDVSIVLGSQNSLIKTGLSLFGVASSNTISTELGVSVYTGYISKRHTVTTKGFIKGYDVFYLLGHGRNENLLGSSLSQYNNSVSYQPQENSSFYGVGFGFEKEYLPYSLSEFNQRIGRFLMRFSKNNNSFNLAFKNDFKGGALFYGDATDFGNTGSLYLSYLHATHTNQIQQMGVVIELFTPKQDYTKIADNTVNSDDGRKNVWYTTGIHSSLFYANAYFAYKYQKNNLVYQINSGLESNKLGAYIQNKLHDSFGLNPRFPWHVSRKNSLYLQGEVSAFKNTL